MKKNVKKMKKTPKQKGGVDVNIPGAAINVVFESIDLGKSVFRAFDGIVSMPADLVKAIPPNIQKTQPAQTPPPAEKPTTPPLTYGSPL
jgi:hypothetical protein